MLDKPSLTSDHPFRAVQQLQAASPPIKSLFRRLCVLFDGVGVLSRLDSLIRQSKVLVQSRNTPIDLFPGNDQRRRNHKMRDPGLNRDALAKYLPGNLIDQQRLTRNLI